MRKGHDITGLRVIGREEGEELGFVLDLVFDAAADECVGLVLREKSFLHEAEVVPWDQIITIGPDAVMVESADSKVGLSKAPRIKEAMDQEFHLAGNRILTTDGKELGSFGDVFLDEKSGRVLGYELSGGFVSDTMSGKRYISAVAGPDIGRDVVLVPPRVQSEIENQEAGGLKGVAQAAGAKVAGAYDAAGAKVSEAYDAAKDKVTEVYGNLAEASIQKQKDFVVGKAANNDVFLPAETSAVDNVATDKVTTDKVATDKVATDVPAWSDSDSPYFVEESENGAFTVRPRRTAVAASNDAATTSDKEAPKGALLVASGETITTEHADKAEKAGILHSLVLAAGGTAISESYDAAKERIVGATQNAQDQVAQTTGKIQQSAEEAAIGQEAGAEVRLANGSILVAPGMIITQELMETAKTNGKDKELIAAAGLGAASNTAQNVGANVQEKAGSLFETVKGKFAELTGTASEKKEEFDAAREQSAINDALGRPTNRIILAKDDSVILNTGDIITHKAVELARSEDVLDVLLSSVADVKPEITPDMLRVQGKGSAALEAQADPEPKTEHVVAPVAPTETVVAAPTAETEGKY
jgi:uncharacterized protein YrrD